MSYIYKKYQKLKEENSDKMYLFKSGNFYIFVGEDADKINEYVVLKKTAFCKEAMKCGFPIQSLNDYMKVFHNHGLRIEVIDEFEQNDIEEILNYLKTIDLDKMTPIKALNLLYEIQEKIV